MSEALSKVFIDVEVDASVAGDAELAKKLEEVCPVDIFNASGSGVEVVEKSTALGGDREVTVRLRAHRDAARSEHREQREPERHANARAQQGCLGASRPLEHAVQRGRREAELRPARGRAAAGEAHDRGGCQQGRIEVRALGDLPVRLDGGVDQRAARVAAVVEVGLVVRGPERRMRGGGDEECPAGPGDAA